MPLLFHSLIAQKWSFPAPCLGTPALMMPGSSHLASLHWIQAKPCTASLPGLIPTQPWLRPTPGPFPHAPGWPAWLEKSSAVPPLLKFMVTRPSGPPRCPADLPTPYSGPDNYFKPALPSLGLNLHPFPHLHSWLRTWLPFTEKLEASMREPSAGSHEVSPCPPPPLHCTQLSYPCPEHQTTLSYSRTPLSKLPFSPASSSIFLLPGLLRQLINMLFREFLGG